MQRLMAMVGADSEEVTRLARAFKQDADYRFKRHAKDGLDLQTLKILIVIPLVLLGLFVALAAVAYRSDPGLVATLTLTAHAFVFLGLAGLNILQDLLGSEDFEVVATWPIRSHSFLLAKLVPAAKNALALALFVSVPVSVYAMFAMGTPVLTGLLLLLTTLLFSLALLLLSAAAIALILRLIGLDNLRLVVVFGSLFVLAGLLLLPYQLGTEIETFTLNGLKFPVVQYADVSAWLPSAWPAAWVALSAGPSAGLALPALLGLCLLTLFPALAFRLAARWFSPALRHGGRASARAHGAVFAKLLCLGSNRPADRVLAQLCVAHARNDWRFRMQAGMVPALSFLLCATLVTEPGAAHLFADPFVPSGFFHPAMVWMIAVMLPPLLALPLISASTDFEAAWWLQQGLIDEVDWRLAVRRLLRTVFVAPILSVLGLIYLWLGVPLLHVAAHVLMLALLAEMMVSMIQAMFSGYPFSRSSQDEELGLKIVIIGLLLEVFGTLIGVVVYHLFYRWWWAYVPGVFMMIVIRRAMLKKGLAQDLMGESGPARPVAQATSPQSQPAPDSSTLALLTAVKSGKCNTARLLLNGSADPLRVDEGGKSALDWAVSLGHGEIEAVLRMAVARGRLGPPASNRASELARPDHPELTHTERPLPD